MLLTIIITVLVCSAVVTLINVIGDNAHCNEDNIIIVRPKTKFSKDDIKRQYKSKLYPFACDFYIKSLDLYIETNGHWSHGWDHKKCLGPFNSNNPEHIKLLNKWKSKDTKYYRNAIKVWTINDILKYKTAKQNKLNYKVFWNLNEVEYWLNSL